MSPRRSLKIGVSGVRGEVGETLSPVMAADFASAFGQFAGAGRILLGRDTRPSGEMLENAVVAGLVAVGCQPILAGVIPTPTLQIVAKASGLSGAIAITASHNSIEWNALKFIGYDGLFLNQGQTAELLDIYNQPGADFVRESEFRNIKEFCDPFGIHQELVLSRIDSDAVRRANFKVAVDCCNGVGALFSRRFLESLGCEVFTVFDRPDGIFGRHPEPLPRHLGELSRIVKERGCHIGFAQDPDGDRIAIVGASGNPLGEQASILLAAEHVLSRSKGEVVVNMQTSKAAEELASIHGSKVSYCPVGEVNVTARMLECGAVFGGEGSSGGVIWPQVHLCRDSFTAMALILEMMALRSCGIEDILSSLPKYFSSSIRVECSGQKALFALRTLAKRHASSNPMLMDGVRIDFDDSSWVLVRHSNTEPALRIMAEARNKEEADSIASRFASEAEAMIRDS